MDKGKRVHLPVETVGQVYLSEGKRRLAGVSERIRGGDRGMQMMVTS